MNVAYCVYPRR